MSADKRPSVVLPHALPLPIFKRLQHRRVVLASSSPRRKDILEVAVCADLILKSLYTDVLFLGAETRDHSIDIRGRSAESHLRGTIGRLSDSHGRRKGGVVLVVIEDYVAYADPSIRRLKCTSGYSVRTTEILPT